jgi:acetyltransferase-like isoleucine patch superfamily enzyme
MSVGRKIRKALLKAYTLYFRIRLLPVRQLKISSDVIIKGMPIIDIAGGAEIYIGPGATLNSRNRGYHFNMHSPVKLIADRKGATIRIGAETRINGTCVHAYRSVTIGEKCLIGGNTQIMDCDGHDPSWENVENRINTTGGAEPVVIEDCVWIGANSIILPGVRIGKGSIISAGSVVVSSIPAMAVAGGNPARVLKPITSKPSPMPPVAATALKSL